MISPDLAALILAFIEAPTTKTLSATCGGR